MSMKPVVKTLILIFCVIVLLLFGIVYLLRPGQGCYNIGDCKECWSWNPVPRQCESGEEPPCVTDPAIEQHNALVDVLLCACAKAREAEYANPTINHRIEQLYPNVMSNYSGTVQEICEQPSSMAPISKWNYV